jgi:putative tryptophan/tyrosine transport system substrate-binding protein
MATVGIMHSGSQETAQKYIHVLKTRLQKDCKTPPAVDGPYFPTRNNHLRDIAKNFIDNNVDLLIAAGGSRSADVAIKQRGSANKPVIVFTSVAPYICNNLNKNTTTGVCAHTSDHDVDRLDWLLKMPLKGRRIGVLRNSSRGDHTKQKDDIDQAMTGHKCTPVHRDINGPDTLKDIFNLFRGDIHGLLVAADPFFNKDRQQVVDRTNADVYPAIYQWREFVELGGLMSYGPSLTNCYDQAGAIAASILNGATNPPYQIWEPRDPDDFELVVSESRARKLGMWPLPKAVADKAQVI